MKKLLLGLALTLSLGTFANSGEIVKDERLEQTTKKCYLLRFDAIYYSNFQAVASSKTYHEMNFYGTFDEAIVESEDFKDSFNYSPILNWTTGTGWSLPVSQPQEVSITKCFNFN
ncbi:hypothetical protein HX004_09655 [Myroides sp. 1354]|uniref:hypothetical protein n=1 Tax=unclassified Myroides TaxID=2642485 RepID=UPI002578AAA4|nr:MULTISPECIES: hypothetical protein [unclassified Myroides]MDM1045159.1 hypothetical protein [Myroides sp. R163-1]MDM1056041.1 hypothetical protein [Myroides sp. 1354]MDM1069010.1 hypothetical protein [Myroides sp. 1372]